MIDTVPRPDASLGEFLAARARHASDGRLVLDTIFGLLIATLVAYWRGPAWHVLFGVAVCFLAFGVWGIADRELGERDDAPGRIRLALRMVRALATAVGFAGGILAIVATLAVALGRMIS